MPKDSIKKKNQLGILAENMNSQFGLVMEGFSVLTTEVKGLKVKVDGLTNQIKEVDDRLSTKINNFQTETNSKFETVFNYLSAIEPQSEKIENLEKRVIIIEKQLTKNK